MRAPSLGFRAYRGLSQVHTRTPPPLALPEIHRQVDRGEKTGADRAHLFGRRIVHTRRPVVLTDALIKSTDYVAVGIGALSDTLIPDLTNLSSWV